MAIPLAYNLRNLSARKVSTVLTALGIGLVSWVFIFTLALAGGFQSALQATGSPTNAIVIRNGSTAELTSIVARDAAASIESQPEIARAPDGTPLATHELVVLWNLKRKNGTPANVVVRGVTAKSVALRPKIHLVEGRMFRPGLEEVVVGKLAQARIAHCALGDRIKLAGRQWSIVGVFDAQGTAFDSEIWGDVELFMPVFDRPVYQSVTLRLDEPSHFGALRKRLEADPRMSVQVKHEDEFYAAQSATLAALLRGLGLFVTLVMALGAIFGALNTMYAAVGSRTKEIGTLLALGFSRGSILTSFLIESVLLATLGGLLGSLMTLPVNGITTSTMNFASFSEIAFRFQVTPSMLLSGMIFAAVMGALGGFFPSRKAARRVIVEALREA
ncbi:MAG: ABC transporter permease [Candidatus Eisenbacteria bacterium]|uniref:ABC transporter permease n=1 Tax=Eiseniibacteriota bacterium TaxID=2212470 RepID=A0A538SSA9_UNCEI|nr:MAG: ABC transporter permease [Candidatus Eisenbacteria bacterium]TMQ63262.1 MAG: ABC transporter permease [Candidatus Eisenbacteria bacterium]